MPDLNSTRLRERILAEFPDMQSYKKGRDVLIAFEDDFGAALAKAYEQDSDEDAVYIAHAAQIVPHQIFGEANPFNGFPERCQEDSVSPLLLTLMNMVLEGPSIKDQLIEKTNRQQHLQLLSCLNSTALSTSGQQAQQLLSDIGLHRRYQFLYT